MPRAEPPANRVAPPPPPPPPAPLPQETSSATDEYGDDVFDEYGILGSDDVFDDVMPDEIMVDTS